MARSLAIALLLIAFCGAVLHAQAPRPPEAPRHTLTIPPGFELVQVGEIKVICQGADRPAVEAAIAAMRPTTRPTTMPQDLMARLESRRQDLLKQVAADFALADSAPINAYLEKLASELKQLDEFRPPLFYLCTTSQKLKSLLSKGEWTTPSLYYNKLADSVTYRETVPISIDRPMDDTIVAVIVEEGASPAELGEKLQKMVGSTREEVARMISGRAMFTTQMTLVEAVSDVVFTPLKLNLDQQWLGVGLSGVMSAEYTYQIIGSPKRELVLLLSAEMRRNPIRMRSIDLLNPTPKSALKREYVSAYADAYRRKSMAVALRFLEQGGREKLPALMRSLREKPCEDGRALVARTKDVAGMDLANDVRAN